MAAIHAAPATFIKEDSGKPLETDAIVASLGRIADRLKAAEASTSCSGPRAQDGTTGEQEKVVTVSGNTVEEVRKSCEEQIASLKVLHAEELRRSQVSHDEEVR